MQLKVNEFPLKEFYCPVSKIIYKSVFDHKKECIFRYCKDGWMWTKGLLDNAVKDEFIDMTTSKEVIEYVNNWNNKLNSI